DDIDASGVTNGTGAVVVTGLVEAFNNDTIKGSGNGDELIMTADGMTADLTTGNVNDMTKITILKGGESDGATLITDGGVGFNDMLMVDASALIDDPLVIGDAGDFIFDGAGDDTTLISGDGDDSIATAGGKDDITTGKGNDTVSSAGDNDVINTGEGDDSVESGGGADVVFAGAGNDTVTGGSDDDTINGEADADMLTGDGGNDTIDGGLGDDTIEGSNGADSLTGGLGEDDFVYSTYNQSRGGNSSIDVITDFSEDDDQFDFSGLNGGGNVFLGNAESFGQAQGLLTGSAGEIVFQQDDMIVWMDDGDATLNGNDLQIDVSGVMMLDTDNFIGLA
ncbi:MAG: calcium-binding protein, partial [Pseudomonadota bacterium]